MRRYLPLLLIAALWLPLLATFREPGEQALQENRQLAPPLTLPRSWPELRVFPDTVNAWAKDHFGFRNRLVVAYNQLRFQLFGEYPAEELLAGKDDSIFFRFGAPASTGLLALCGAGLTPEETTERMTEIAGFLSRIRTLDAKSYLLVVPEKSRVYPQKLPDWIQRDCARGTPPVPAMLNILGDALGLQKSMLYPLAALQAADPPAYPAANLHWTEAGAQPIARLVAESVFKLTPTVSLPYRPIPAYSDLSSFMPGLAIPIAESAPDFAAADVLACQHQASCFPEFSNGAGKLDDVSRFRRDYLLPHEKRRPRLLIISDSFGTAIAPGFVPYFAEVWHFSMNGLDKRLARDQQEQLRHLAFDMYRPDIVLFTFSELNLLLSRKYFEDVGQFVTGP